MYTIHFFKIFNTLIRFFRKYEDFKEYVELLLSILQIHYRFHDSECKNHSLGSCTTSNFAGFHRYHQRHVPRQLQNFCETSVMKRGREEDETHASS